MCSSFAFLGNSIGQPMNSNNRSSAETKTDSLDLDGNDVLLT